MTSPIKINDTPIKTPHDFRIERFNLTKAGRTADGTMQMDLIAKKRTFQFVYNAIRGKELEHLLSLIDTDEVFVKLEYQENGKTRTATVYAGAIPTQLQRRVAQGKGEWVWTDVEFQLIEQ